MIQQGRAGLNISFKGGKVLRSFQTFHHNELHRINSFGLTVAGFYLAEVSRMTVWSRIKEMLYFVLISTSDYCGKIQMVVRKQTISSVPFPSNTGETLSQRKGFCAQHGDAFTMPWLRQAWPFHLLQPWAVQCGWNCKLLGTHCDHGIWHKHVLGRNAPICCIQWRNENSDTGLSSPCSLFQERRRGCVCPSLMGSWGRCQALLWAGMLAPSWHGLVTSVPQHQAELPPGPAGTSQLDRGAAAARAWPWPSHLDAVPGTSSVGLFLWLQMCFVGSPLRWIICLLLLVSWAHKRVFLPPAAGRAWATGAHLRAGGWHHAMPAGRATLGPACHTQQVRLSPCVRLWACQRALRVQLCLCNTVWLWELSTQSQEPSIGPYVSCNS